MASAKKKSEAEAGTQAQEEAPEEAPGSPASGAFESHIKDGPTQDDLNPAYARPKDEGAAADEAAADDGE